MKTLTRVTFITIISMMVLYACVNFPTPTPPPTDPINNILDGPVSAVGLAVEVVNGTTIFNTVGQVINYRYRVTNTGSTPLAGPVTITDDKTTIPTCDLVSTVGNLNNNLDTGEIVTCTSTYTITQVDLTAGTVTNNSTARVGGVDSNRVPTTVRMTVTPAGALTVNATANPTTYSTLGQTITYSYSIRNSGTTSLGPDQFRVTDSRFTAPILCDVASKTLAPNDTINCNTSTYTITQNDLNAASISNTVTGSGGGVTSAAVTVTVTRSGVPGAPPVTPGNYTKGSTIQHRVVKGEWLLQIARCYAVNVKNIDEYNRLLNANPSITNPNFILPEMTVTVPNIGSNNTPIYGPPCVGYYVVQVGDTWDNIKTRFNADVEVLQAANRNVSLSNGTCIRIPLNSAYGSTGAQTALTACPGTSTPIPQPQGIRITIPSGSTTTSVIGTVQAPNKVRYLLATTAGQTLNVRVLNAPANEVSMGVFAANGTTLKAQDTNLTFTGVIPVTGDTAIDLMSVTGTNIKSFTLEVTLTSSSQTTFERVADINTGINNSDPAYLAVFNGQLFFKAAGPENAGAELWRYDPTSRTATLAKDILQGTAGSDPAFLNVFNSALYFRANGDANGTELWRWNGSDAGRLTDINPNAGNANPSYMTVFNNALYFSARASDGQGMELWRTDGTTAVPAANAAGKTDPSHLTVFNNALYFSAGSTDGTGVELWKYDGTNAPTRVSDINPGVGNSNPAHLMVFNGVLYFSANANDGKGIELWKYDGTNNPSLVADINAGAGDSAPSFLTVFSNALYFSANGNDNSGVELWKYTGTGAPTRVSEINTAGNSNPSYLIVFNNELYFQANSNDGTGTELWKFKGP